MKPDITTIGELNLGSGMQYCTKEGSTEGFMVGIVVAKNADLRLATVLAYNWDGHPSLDQVAFSTPCIWRPIIINGAPVTKPETPPTPVEQSACSCPRCNVVGPNPPLPEEVWLKVFTRGVLKYTRSEAEDWAAFAVNSYRRSFPK